MLPKEKAGLFEEFFGAILVFDRKRVVAGAHRDSVKGSGLPVNDTREFARRGIRRAFGVIDAVRGVNR